MTFMKSVEKLNAELEQKIKQYGQEKERLSEEITKRSNNYKDSFENVDSKNPPYVTPEENADSVDSDFVWVPAKWLHNFIIGRDAVATSKGNKGTQESVKQGESIETSDNAIIDLANDDENIISDKEVVSSSLMDDLDGNFLFINTS